MGIQYETPEQEREARRVSKRLSRSVLYHTRINLEEVWHSSSCGLREKGMHSYIAQVAEQGTQMTPVGEVVTTNMGRLSMPAKVNETGVQVDFLHYRLR